MWSEALGSGLQQPGWVWSLTKYPKEWDFCFLSHYAHEGAGQASWLYAGLHSFVVPCANWQSGARTASRWGEGKAEGGREGGRKSCQMCTWHYNRSDATSRVNPFKFLINNCCCCHRAVMSGSLHASILSTKNPLVLRESSLISLHGLQKAKLFQLENLLFMLLFKQESDLRTLIIFPYIT